MPSTRFTAARQSDKNASERSLALRQLLNRFVSICNTVAYGTAGESCTGTSSLAT